jgi:hypothetical protein
LPSAAIPKDIAVYQNPKGALPGCPCGLRKPAYGKLILPGLGREFHEAGVGAEKGVAFPIRLDALSPGDSMEIDWNLFKAVP